MSPRLILLLAIAFIFSNHLHGQSPQLSWAKAQGGLSDEKGNAIALDASGNTYVAGYFRGTTDFDPGTSTFTMVSAGSADIFICKLDNSGNFIWARQMGGRGEDIANAISVDNLGNVTVAGNFNDTADFDPGAGVSNLVSAGSTDIFIARLDASGNFLWADRIGAAGQDEANGITTDPAGNIYTTGSFRQTVDFDPTPGVYTLSSSGTMDIFISKLRANGNFVWARHMTGGIEDEGNAITIDASGNVYTTGTFREVVDFDPGPGVFNITCGNYNFSDVFVSKLDSNGNFIWAGAIIGSQGESAYAVKTDPMGNVFFTGMFFTSTDFNPGAGGGSLTPAGQWDIFVCKWDSSRNFVWAKRLGGTDSESGRALAIDASGNVYVSGYFGGLVDFDPGAGVHNIQSIGSGPNVFVCKLDAAGIYSWAVAMGGLAAASYGAALAVDGGNNIYATGNFRGSVDFDPTFGYYPMTSTNSITDIFVFKLSQPPSAVADQEASHEFQVYPNPAGQDAICSFQLKNNEMPVVMLYDMTGREIPFTQFSKNEAGLYAVKISLENLAPGVYFLVLHTDGRSVTRKLVKQ